VTKLSVAALLTVGLGLFVAFGLLLAMLYAWSMTWI
jgi:hypothetical protein